MNEPARPRFTGKLVLGFVLVILGTVFTLDNLGLVRSNDILRFWPFAFIAIGISQLAQDRWRLRQPGPIVLLVIGTAFALKNFTTLRLRARDVIPVFLVLIGLWIILQQFRRRFRAAPGAGGVNEETLNNFVLFGGFDRRVTSTQFKGGDLGAFCGGWEVDLSKAEMAGSEATIDIFAWWGGGEIRVPEEWNVVVKVLPILGGAGDKTHHPTQAGGAAAKTLYVTGVVVMGGVEIKN
jgi:predicted membrane protein